MSISLTSIPVRVKSVRCLLLSAPYSAPGDAERERHLRSGLRSAAFFIAEGYDGICGVGEAYAGSYAPEVVRAIADHLTPCFTDVEVENVADIIALARHAIRYWGRTGVSQGVLGGVEMAILDLVSRQRGLPLHKLLGTHASESLTVYASGGNDKPPDELRAEMLRYVAEGFGAVKIRINNLPLDQMVKKVRLCSEVLEGRAELAVDAVQSNTRYPLSLDEAQRLADALAPYRLLWLEEPLPPEDVHGLKKLRQSSPIPIASGETATTMDEVSRFLENEAIDILQPDAAVMGVSRFMETAAACDAAGVRLAVHAWCGGPGHLANYHCAFASPSCFIVEMGSVANPLRSIVLAETVRVKDGRLSLVDRPGLGFDMPENLSEQYPYRPGTNYHF